MSIRRDTAYNLLGSVIPLAVSLVTIPIYLKLIGEARYGILAIAWLMLGYFGLFDLGLGRATAQRIAALRDAPAAGRAQTFWTALSLNAGLGILGGLLIWPLAAYFFAQVFEIGDALRPEALAAVPWLILAVPMATLSGVLSGALQGRQRFLELNLVSITGTVLFQLLPLGLAALGQVHLGVLLPAALAARLVTLLLLYWRCSRHLTQGQPIAFDRSQAGALLRFGGWVTVSAFVGPLMVVLDRFIIGAVSGARAVTYYTIPFQLAERSTLLAGVLSFALFPRLAGCAPEEERPLAKVALETVVALTTPLTACGILLIAPFLTWWVGPELAAQSAPIGQTLLLGFWINALARIPHGQLQARGRPDITAKIHLAELLPYLALLYASLQTAGPLGAAIVFSLRTGVDYALLAAFAGILRPTLGALAIPLGLLGLALVIATQAVPGSAFWWTAVLGQLLATTLWAWHQAPGPVRRAVASALRTGGGLIPTSNLSNKA